VIYSSRCHPLHARSLPHLLFSPCHTTLSTHSDDSSIPITARYPANREMKHVYPTSAVAAGARSISNYTTHSSCSTSSPRRCTASRLFPRGGLCSGLPPQFRGSSLVNFWRTRVRSVIVYVHPSIGATIHTRLDYVFGTDVVYVTDEGDVPPSVYKPPPPPARLYLSSDLRREKRWLTSR